MNRVLVKSVISVGLLALLMLTIPAHAGNVNSSVKISADSESDGASTVNGSITVGENAVVAGDVETVNGSVTVKDNATIRDADTVNGAVRLGSGVNAEDLDTVNGSITIDENSAISGRVDTVNGSIRVDNGSTVAKNVSNVNGEIEISGGQIGGDLETVNGDIHLSDGAIIKGDVIVEKSNSGWVKKKKRLPKVIIGPGTRVHGEIRLKREVELYISSTAEVGGVSGVMSMDDAIRFDGAYP